MPAMPYTPTDILTLDRALAALAKKCCKLPITYPTASIHLPHTHGGLGVPSLTTNYTQIICTNLTRALNDPGKLGHITHALLHTETTQPHTNVTHHTLTRQLHLMASANIQILNKGQPQIGRAHV